MWKGEKTTLEEIEEFEYSLSPLREDFPEVIVDEIKPIFGISKIGKCYVTVKGKIKVASLVHEGIPLHKYDGEITLSDKEKIRKVLLFRWFLNLKNNNESSILVLPTPMGVDFTSFVEKSFTDKEEKCEIGKRCFKKYFGSHEEWNEAIEEFIPRNVNSLREELTSVVKRVDPQWLEVVAFWCSKFSREREFRRK